MGVRIWDRLLDTELSQLLPGPLALGRLVLLEGDRSLSLAGRVLMPGDYLATTGEWMLWDDGAQAHVAGRTERHAVPDDPTVQTVIALGARLGLLAEDAAGVVSWLAETPLMERSAVEPRLRRDRLDEVIGRTSTRWPPCATGPPIVCAR